MVRHSPYAAMLLMGLGLLGWIGWAAAQRIDGRPPLIASSSPPPVSPQAGRGDTNPALSLPATPGSPTVAGSNPALPVQRTSAFSPPTSGMASPPAEPPALPCWGLTLEKAGSPTFASGTATKYEIVIRNTGTVPQERIRIEDELPVDAQVVASEPRAEVQGTSLSWVLPRLDAGGQQRLRVVFRPGRDGAFQSSPRATLIPESSPPTQLSRPFLVIREMGPERAEIGQPVVFEIQLVNAGSVPATHVVLHDTLPDGLQHPQGPRVLADVGTLAPGESRTIPLTITALRSGRFVNEVLVTADADVKASDLVTLIVVERGAAEH